LTRRSAAGEGSAKECGSSGHNIVAVDSEAIAVPT